MTHRELQTEHQSLLSFGRHTVSDHADLVVGAVVALAILAFILWLGGRP